MNLVSVTLKSLVDLALEDLQSVQETGRPVVRVEAIGPTENTCHFRDPQFVNVSDVVEFGTELVRIVGKSAHADPVFTIARGVYATTPQTHPPLQVGSLNPQWNRQRVARAVQRAFPRMEAFGLQIARTETVAAVPEVGGGWRHLLELPNETRQVLSLRKGLVEFPDWEFLDDAPVSEYPTGKVIRLPRMVLPGDEFSVVYKVPYRWSSFPDQPVESDTIELPEGSEDLPAAYAVCLLISNREISRSEIDRVSEWAEGEPQRGGVSLSMVRYRWQEFYRAVDEARRLDPHQPRRPYIRRTRRA